MQVTETSAAGLKHEFTVVVAASDIERQIQDRLTEIGRSVRLPGFRPGKAPISVLKKRYGPSVLGEVVERAVNDSSSAAIRERNLRPALQPKIEIVSFNEGKDLEYKLAVEVLPEIAPIDFAAIQLERWKPDVADKEIDEALERIAKQQRKSEKVEREAKTGDIVAIDFKGTVGGVAFPGGSAENYMLELGSGRFIPGFEDQLAGSKAGEARSVAVTFPADYGNAELAGKAAEFAVTVREVRETGAAGDRRIARRGGRHGKSGGAAQGRARAGGARIRRDIPEQAQARIARHPGRKAEISRARGHAANRVRPALARDRGRAQTRQGCGRARSRMRTKATRN